MAPPSNAALPEPPEAEPLLPPVPLEAMSPLPAPLDEAPLPTSPVDASPLDVAPLDEAPLDVAPLDEPLAAPAPAAPLLAARLLEPVPAFPLPVVSRVPPHATPATSGAQRSILGFTGPSFRKGAPPAPRHPSRQRVVPESREREARERAG